MITLVIRYTLDVRKFAEFERYARTWTEMIPRNEGKLVGYFVPTKIAGPTNIAYALIQFPNLTVYERYRDNLMRDPDVIRNIADVENAGAILIEERSILKQVS